MAAASRTRSAADSVLLAQRRALLDSFWRASQGARRPLSRGGVSAQHGIMQRTSRLKRELMLLTTEPPPGVTCWQNNSQVDDLRAQIVGGADTPYEKGVFSLELVIPERYPFEPPKIRFLTPIYHPNIDSAGRICLDILKLPPKGAWRPSLNLSTVLTSIQLLMSEPNPDDPLMADISSEYKYNKQMFLKNAALWTEKHAVQKKENLQTSTKEESHVGVSTASDSQKRQGALLSGKAKKVCLEP